MLPRSQLGEDVTRAGKADEVLEEADVLGEDEEAVAVGGKERGERE
jgi:hypothetical protein